METVFPDTYRRWSLKHLGEMIEDPDLAWVVDGGAAGTLAALRSAAKGATELVIATDYDREGELIGHEALEILRGDALKRHPDDKRRREEEGGRGQGRARPRRRRRPSRPTTATRTSRPCCRPAVVDRHVRVRYSALTDGRGPGRLRQAVHRRLQPRRGGALAPGHRPHLGRGAHALHVAGRRTATAPTTSPSAACRRRRCASSSSASSSAAPSCRCRTGRSRPTLERDDEPSRWRTPRAASTPRRPWRPPSAGAGAEHRRGHRLQGRAAPGQAAGAVQHHGAHERRLRRRA